MRVRPHPPPLLALHVMHGRCTAHDFLRVLLILSILAPPHPAPSYATDKRKLSKANTAALRSRLSRMSKSASNVAASGKKYRKRFWKSVTAGRLAPPSAPFPSISSTSAEVASAEVTSVEMEIVVRDTRASWDLVRKALKQQAIVNYWGMRALENEPLVKDGTPVAAQSEQSSAIGVAPGSPDTEKEDEKEDDEETGSLLERLREAVLVNGGDNTQKARTRCLPTHATACQPSRGPQRGAVHAPTRKARLLSVRTARLTLAC